jgi:hypothetical protein
METIIVSGVSLAEVVICGRAEQCKGKCIVLVA